MKRFSVLLIAMVIMVHIPTYAALELITFDVEIFDHSSVGSGPNRGPVLPPEVYVDDYTLLFDTSCDGCLLRIVNEDDEVVFTTVISGSTLVLPSNLSGDYQLQIISGNYMFYGDISL